MSARKDLSSFAWLSIAAAIITIGLKTGAWALTGSVGLLSDAAESVVNLVAAIVALIALKVSARPADERYTYGRSKAEYFSAAIEGIMIFIAAAVILVTSAQRFVHPRPIENVDTGLLISVAASVINGAVALVLIRAGRKYRSMTLTADGKHLMTDVVTSVGVLLGVLLVVITKWDRLDALVAFAVGVNIIITGAKLVSESAAGLMDHTLPPEENDKIVAILQGHSSDHVAFHGLQTRVAGHQRFANMHVLVPGDWTVTKGHDFVESLETELSDAVPGLIVMTHLEPLEDPRAWDDIPAGELNIHRDPPPVDPTVLPTYGAE